MATAGVDADRRLLIRRPLLLAVLLGCGVSMLASGRFTLRLVLDGTISFAFVPLCELIAFAAVARGGRRIQPFARAVDQFFATNMDRLDGTEFCHPAAFDYPQFRPELEEFAKKTNAAAIGSSDFHRPGRLGLCRTFVFAGEASAEAVLEAIRARRTVVYGRDNQVYGDPELIRIAEADGRLRRLASTEYPVSALGRISQMLGIAGLALIVLRSSARAGAAVRQR